MQRSALVVLACFALTLPITAAAASRPPPRGESYPVVRGNTIAPARKPDPPRYTYLCQTSGECQTYDEISKTYTPLNVGATVAALTTDPSGDIYVSEGADTVSLYAPLARSRRGTLANPGQQSAAIAWSSKALAIANGNGYAAGTGQLSIYAPRAKSPSYYLGDGDPNHRATGVAFDSRGNCFVTLVTPLKGFIDEFAGCAAGAKAKRLHISFRQSYCCYTASPTFDQHDNLMYSIFAFSEPAGNTFKCNGLRNCTDFGYQNAYLFGRDFRYAYEIFYDHSSGFTALRCPVPSSGSDCLTFYISGAAIAVPWNGIGGH